MEEIRERFKQKSSCESVRLRKRSSILYSTEVFVPRVFQALLAAYADVKLYNLVLRWETPDVARWTLLSSPDVNCWTGAVWIIVISCLDSHSDGTHSLQALALGVSTLIDSVFYGKWILVQWNFLKFNVLHNVTVFYGAHPWHWYFTQGLPVVLGPHLPLFLHGCSLATKKHRILLITVLWTTAIYSLLAQKEFRFVYPVLPLCMIFSGMSLAKLQAWRKPAAAALLLFSLIPALYTGLIQQRGPLDVMHDLQQLCDVSDSQSSPELLFLMPCHSTPLYSHLHCPLNLRFLECPPDLTGNEEYVDEADVFFSNPLHWLRTSFPSQSTLPSHILLFDCLEKEISSFLEENRFAKKAEIFHTHYPEGRVGRNILIYTRGPELKTK